MLWNAVSTHKAKKGPPGQQGEHSSDPGPAEHCHLLCRPNACLGLSTAWVGSKSRGGFVRWGEGGVGTLKQVHDVSGAGEPNKALGGDRDKKRLQALQMGKYFLRNYRNKVSFFISHLPKNSLPHTKCPATLLCLPTCVACVAKGRGRREEKVRVEDHFPLSREGQKHSWAREPAGEAQGGALLLSMCWWTSTEGKTSWRRERQRRRLVASLRWAGWGSGWQCLCKQGATAPSLKPRCLRVPPGLQIGARRSPQQDECKSWLKPAFLSLLPSTPTAPDFIYAWPEVPLCFIYKWTNSL